MSKSFLNQIASRLVESENALVSLVAFRLLEVAFRIKGLIGRRLRAIHLT